MERAFNKNVIALYTIKRRSLIQECKIRTDEGDSMDTCPTLWGAKIRKIKNVEICAV